MIANMKVEWIIVIIERLIFCDSRSDERWMLCQWQCLFHHHFIL